VAIASKQTVEEKKTLEKAFLREDTFWNAKAAERSHMKAPKQAFPAKIEVTSQDMSAGNNAKRSRNFQFPVLVRSSRTETCDG